MGTVTSTAAPAAPVLLDAALAATYAGVRPASLRVWRHRYGLTPYWSADGANQYDLHELAAVLAKRAGEQPAVADVTQPRPVDSSV